MNFLVAVLTTLGALIFFAVILALPVMLLWDACVPQIFGLPEITFWQALCLNMLCSALFKSSNNSN